MLRVRLGPILSTSHPQTNPPTTAKLIAASMMSWAFFSPAFWSSPEAIATFTV